MHRGRRRTSDGSADPYGLGEPPTRPGVDHPGGEADPGRCLGDRRRPPTLGDDDVSPGDGDREGSIGLCAGRPDHGELSCHAGHGCIVPRPGDGVHGRRSPRGQALPGRTPFRPALAAVPQIGSGLPAQIAPFNVRLMLGGILASKPKSLSQDPIQEMSPTAQ